jgi:hypothetical protein
LIARAIHNTGKRSDRPFVAVSCGAIPESLTESELFGHEKGAVTGTVAAREGYFEKAGDGTLFLDEIGELSPRLRLVLRSPTSRRPVAAVFGSPSLSVNRLFCSRPKRWAIRGCSCRGCGADSVRWPRSSVTVQYPREEHFYSRRPQIHTSSAPFMPLAIRWFWNSSGTPICPPARSHSRSRQMLQERGITSRNGA